MERLKEEQTLIIPPLEVIEWPFYERGKYWILSIIIGVCSIIIISFLNNSLSLGLLAFSIGVWYFLNHQKHPKKYSFCITEQGIEIDNNHYDFKKIKKFWFIVPKNHLPILHISMSEGEDFSCIIPLSQKIAIKKVLNEYIDEDVHATENAIDMIIRILKL